MPRCTPHGRNVAGSILRLDITGEDVEATGLVWSNGDADLLRRPVPGTLKPVPWLLRTGQVMLSMYELDGRPAAADPRHVLRRVVERLACAGYTAVVACELEFYRLRTIDGQPVPGGSGAATHLNERDRIDAYGARRLDDLAPLFAEVFDAARMQGLPVGTLMSEYAPGPV